MALRPPSNQRARDDYYSGDPAFVQPPSASAFEDEAAHTKARLDHAEKVRRARETGQWDELAIAGVMPTKFVMLPLGAEVTHKLIDRMRRTDEHKMGVLEVAYVAFRCALSAVENCGDIKVTRQEDPEWGSCASAAVVDTIFAIDQRIIFELGDEAFSRSTRISPK